MLRHILFTHTDLDGAGCRILFDYIMRQRSLINGRDYIICNADISNLYATVTETINNFDCDSNTEIYFADICCGDHLMKQLTEKFKKIHVYDHHKTNTWANDFPGIDAYVYETNSYGRLESGTSIMWRAHRDELLHPVIIAFTNAVRSYDNFEFKTVPNKNAVLLNKYFSMIGMEAFCNSYVSFLEDAVNHSYESYEAAEFSDVYNLYTSIDDHENITILHDIEYFIIESALKVENDQIEKIINGEKKKSFSFEYTDNDGISYIVFNTINGISMSSLAAAYLETHPEYDVFVWFDINRKGLSFRSISDDIDVSEIAKRLGGGGHPKASGAMLNDHCINAIGIAVFENL